MPSPINGYFVKMSLHSITMVFSFFFWHVHFVWMTRLGQVTMTLRTEVKTELSCTTTTTPHDLVQIGVHLFPKDTVVKIFGLSKSNPTYVPLPLSLLTVLLRTTHLLNELTSRPIKKTKTKTWHWHFKEEFEGKYIGISKPQVSPHFNTSRSLTFVSLPHPRDVLGRFLKMVTFSSDVFSSSNHMFNGL